MYIASTGFVSPVGLYSEAACAALRAGISAFSELSYLDNRGKPIVGAVVPDIPLDINREKRLLLMITHAVSECIAKQGNPDLLRVPIFICLAEQGRPGGGWSLAEDIIGAIEEELSVKFNPHGSGVICNGHTSAYEALMQIKSLMNGGKIQHALLCGADSYINASSLFWLERHLRLKTEENSDGVIPGEAAGAVFIDRSPQQNSRGRRPVISAIALGEESATVLNDSPLMAKGISKAIQAALAEANLMMEDIDLRMTDATGEAYFFKEQLYSKMKLQRKDSPRFVDLWHPSENMGDVGSASGLVPLIYAKETLSQKGDGFRNLLCTTSNVSTKRAAAVIKLV